MRREWTQSQQLTQSVPPPTMPPIEVSSMGAGMGMGIGMGMGKDGSSGEEMGNEWERERD